MKNKKIGLIIGTVIVLIIGAIICIAIKEGSIDYSKELEKMAQESMKDLKKPPAVKMKKEVENLIGYPNSNLEFSYQSETFKIGSSNIQVSKIVLDDKEKNSETINRNITQCLKSNLKHCKQNQSGIWEGKVEYVNDAIISISFINEGNGVFYCSFWRKSGEIIKTGEIVNLESLKTKDTLNKHSTKVSKDCTNFGIYFVNPKKDYKCIYCSLSHGYGPDAKGGTFLLKDFCEDSK